MSPQTVKKNNRTVIVDRKFGGCELHIKRQFTINIFPCAGNKTPVVNKIWLYIKSKILDSVGSVQMPGKSDSMSRAALTGCTS